MPIHAWVVVCIVQASQWLMRNREYRRREWIRLNVVSRTSFGWIDVLFTWSLVCIFLITLSNGGVRSWRRSVVMQQESDPNVCAAHANWLPAICILERILKDSASWAYLDCFFRHIARKSLIVYHIIYVYAICPILFAFILSGLFITAWEKCPALKT